MHEQNYYKKPQFRKRTLRCIDYIQPTNDRILRWCRAEAAVYNTRIHCRISGRYYSFTNTFWNNWSEQHKNYAKGATMFLFCVLPKQSETKKLNASRSILARVCCARMHTNVLCAQDFVASTSGIRLLHKPVNSTQTCTISKTVEYCSTHFLPHVHAGIVGFDCRND